MFASPLMFSALLLNLLERRAVFTRSDEDQVVPLLEG